VSKCISCQGGTDYQCPGCIDKLIRKKPISNTERLIASLEFSSRFGVPYVTFSVGKYTGNGPSVVAALRRRGFKVDRCVTPGTYKLENPIV